MKKLLLVWLWYAVTVYAQKRYNNWRFYFLPGLYSGKCNMPVILGKTHILQA